VVPDTKLPAGLNVVIQLLPRRAAHGKMAGYSAGNYAFFVVWRESSLDGLCRQVGMGMVSLYFPLHYNDSIGETFAMSETEKAADWPPFKYKKCRFDTYASP